jgi:hypothetical protein
MKKKVTILAAEIDFSVDLTLHDISASLLTEFVEKIVRPYYSDNTSDAVKDLMQKAIKEDDFVSRYVKLD